MVLVTWNEDGTIGSASRRWAVDDLDVTEANMTAMGLGNLMTEALGIIPVENYELLNIWESRASNYVVRAKTSLTGDNEPAGEGDDISVR